MTTFNTVLPLLHPICRKGKYRITGGDAVGGGLYTRIILFCVCGCDFIIWYDHRTQESFTSKKEALNYLQNVICVRVED